MTNEVVVNEIDCFAVDGGKEYKIEPQSILPDITDFELVGDDLKNGQECQRWQKIVQMGQKVSKYTMWLKVVPSTSGKEGLAVPVHYEMRGYNSLLGSHFDHYYLSYENFSPEVPDSEVFDLYQGKSCHGWPGPGADHVYTMNPIKEFVENHEAHVRDTFEQFKVHHDKKYRDENDEESRLDVYRQNLRYIHSKNRKGLTYTLASNHLADMTNSEMMVLRGRIHDSNLKTNGGQAHKYTKAEVKDAPDVLDWR